MLNHSHICLLFLMIRRKSENRQYNGRQKKDKRTNNGSLKTLCRKLRIEQQCLTQLNHGVNSDASED